MIHQENPTLTYADAGPISAAFSENPMLHHSCGGKMEDHRTRLCRANRPATAAYRQNPVRSAHQNSQP